MATGRLDKNLSVFLSISEWLNPFSTVKHYTHHIPVSDSNHRDNSPRKSIYTLPPTKLGWYYIHTHLVSYICRTLILAVLRVNCVKNDGWYQIMLMCTVHGAWYTESVSLWPTWFKNKEWSIGAYQLLTHFFVNDAALIIYIPAGCGVRIDNWLIVVDGLVTVVDLLSLGSALLSVSRPALTSPWYPSLLPPSIHYAKAPSSSWWLYISKPVAVLRKTEDKETVQRYCWCICSQSDDGGGGEHSLGQRLAAAWPGCIKAISFASSRTLQMLHAILGLPHASAKQF